MYFTLKKYILIGSFRYLNSIEMTWNDGYVTVK